MGFSRWKYQNTLNGTREIHRIAYSDPLGEWAETYRQIVWLFSMPRWINIFDKYQ